ncbi:MAG: thioredoxin [Acidimicrobiaceae bacterium]|nr:thioredoxin [Acidimicrobiaceae bacterium]
MATIEANSKDSFESEVLKSEIPVVVDFWAPWCAPCRMVAPELDSMASERVGEIKVVKVNVDINQEVASKYQVFSIPTIGLFKAGELVASSIGAKPKRLIEADLGISN